MEEGSGDSISFIQLSDYLVAYRITKLEYKDKISLVEDRIIRILTPSWVKMKGEIIYIEREYFKLVVLWYLKIVLPL